MLTCECGFKCDRKFNLERHLESKAHQLNLTIKIEKQSVYECEICEFRTSFKGNYRKHLLSSKHQIIERHAQTVAAAPEEVYAQKETVNEQVSVKSEAPQPVMLTEVMDMFMKFHSEQMKLQNEKSNIERIQNTEMFKSLMDRVLACQQHQQKPPQNQVLSPPTTLQNVVMENTNSMTNSQNTSNSNNKHFNLHFYLNEECKNAMNMSDFIKSVVISMEDLEHLGTVGYTEGMQRILTKALQEKEKKERPMHCSDVKREVIYVRKDDVWLKDDSKEETEKFIRYIYHKNLKMMKEWGDEHPEHQVSDSPEYDYWYSITRNMCNTNPNAMKKLISHLARLTAIEKGSLTET